MTSTVSLLLRHCIPARNQCINLRNALETRLATRVPLHGRHADTAEELSTQSVRSQNSSSQLEFGFAMPVSNSNSILHRAIFHNLSFQLHWFIGFAGSSNANRGRGSHRQDKLNSLHPEVPRCELFSSAEPSRSDRRAYGERLDKDSNFLSQTCGFQSLWQGRAFHTRLSAGHCPVCLQHSAPGQAQTSVFCRIRHVVQVRIPHLHATFSLPSSLLVHALAGVWPPAYLCAVAGKPRCLWHQWRAFGPTCVGLHAVVADLAYGLDQASSTFQPAASLPHEDREHDEAHQLSWRSPLYGSPTSPGYPRSASHLPAM